MNERFVIIGEQNNWQSCGVWRCYDGVVILIAGVASGEESEAIIP